MALGDAPLFVDIANRGILKTLDANDKLVLSQIHSIKFKTRLGISGKDNHMVELVRAIAKGIALDLTVAHRKPAKPDGSARVRVVHSMHLERALPEVVDNWLLWSNQLGRQVRVSSLTGAQSTP